MPVDPVVAARCLAYTQLGTANRERVRRLTVVLGLLHLSH